MEKNVTFLKNYCENSGPLTSLPVVFIKHYKASFNLDIILGNMFLEIRIVQKYHILCMPTIVRKQVSIYKYQVPSIRYQASGNKYLVTSTS